MSSVQQVACKRDGLLGERIPHVHGMFYTFIFQDALHFGISGEDVIVDLAEVIENYRWLEFEA